MKPHYTLLLLALLAAPRLLAQEERIKMDDTAVPEPSADPDRPHTIVEVMPSFPGGTEALFAYIAKEMHYPDTATNATVYVGVVVERDGSLTQHKVIRDVGCACPEEAIRVVKTMPKWTPGLHEGKPVRVNYTIPFRQKQAEKKGFTR